ncbi:MAG: DegT/DnrJ/EryC1/StrS family aminotransferase [Candidatus Bathyarchaeota archaeon]|nr:DegT/DnrJ/EryC1/StrS family aminotransferase [Candidatus Bathyarchaeota archaeon]
MSISGSCPYFSNQSIDEITNEIRSMLKSGKLTDGPYGQEFEKKFAHYNNTKYAIAVSSGSASLDVALRHYELRGREVIVPTNTFIATPNGVIFAGGKPVFADMNAQTLGIDIEDVKRKVNRNTAGVIVVHIGGLVCPQIHELKAFCRQRGLFLIEDCAHAHGAMMDGKKAGTFGDVGCFSFYPTKVMTACEGGMIITDDDEIAKETRITRTNGQNTDRYMVMLGHNWRMSELSAIVGKNQLEHLDEFLAKRNQVAGWYQEALLDVEGIELFHKPPNFRHSYYKYPIKLADTIDRIKLAGTLKEQYGIETGHVYYPPCHLHPYYKETYGTRAGDLPTAERVLPQVMCLPMHCGVTKENVKYIKNALITALTKLPLQSITVSSAL